MQTAIGYIFLAVTENFEGRPSFWQIALRVIYCNLQLWLPALSSWWQVRSSEAAERGIIRSRTIVKVLRVFCYAFEASTQFKLQRSIRPY